jgi:SAM-dependent methyltransferase
MGPVSGDELGGRDQDYLRDVQYKDPTHLSARADLHTKYSSAPVAWVPWVKQQIDWPAGGDVLEVGCGPGWLWADGAGLPAGLRLTLTDLSPGMVEVARQRAAASSSELVEARLADAQELPLAADSYDVVVANHMLYHVPDPEKAVAELARVLRPGGVLMAATNGPRHLVELWEIRAEVFGGAPISVLPDIFGSITGRPILGRSFAQVQWRHYADTLLCTSSDDVVAFLTSSPPGLDAASDQLSDLRQAVQRRIDAGGGVFTVSKETGLFLAR